MAGSKNPTSLAVWSFNNKGEKTEDMFNVLVVMLFICIISMTFTIICLMISMSIDTKLSNCKPQKGVILKAFLADKKTETTDYDKACYLLVKSFDGSEKLVGKREPVSNGQNSILLQSDGKHYRMYSEKKMYRDREISVAMWKPRKWMLMLLVVSSLVCILFICDSYYQKHSSDYTRLEQIQKEKSEEYNNFFAEKIEQSSGINLLVLYHVFWKEIMEAFTSHSKSVDAFLYNITIYDTLLMSISGNTKISDPPTTKCFIRNYVIRKIYEENEDVILANRSLTEEKELREFECINLFFCIGMIMKTIKFLSIVNYSAIE